MTNKEKRNIIWGAGLGMFGLCFYCKGWTNAYTPMGDLVISAGWGTLVLLGTAVWANYIQKASRK